MVKCLPNSSTKHQSLRPNWKTFLLDDDIITAIAGILVWTLFLFYDSIWSLLISMTIVGICSKFGHKVWNFPQFTVWTCLKTQKFDCNCLNTCTYILVTFNYHLVILKFKIIYKFLGVSLISLSRNEIFDRSIDHLTIQTS